MNSFLRASKLGAGVVCVTAFSTVASAQSFTVTGAGGTFPTNPNGTDGAYPVSGFPGLLPSSELSTTVTVPASVTQFTQLKVVGLVHTWSGDAHFVLVSPSGVAYNVMTPPNIYNPINYGYGNMCDFNGDYTFVDPSAPGSLAWPIDAPTCTDPGMQTPGVYPQYFGSGPGAWPTGALGINNIPFSAIPAVGGTWTLKCYDWYIAGEDGTFTSWELSGLGVVGPVAYCTAGTTSSGCNAAISGTGNPNVAHTAPCQISVSGVEGQKAGILFYGLQSQSLTWCSMGGGTSFLCVKAPQARTGVQQSGGTLGQCNGTLALDWNAYQSATPGALGAPWSAGTKAYVQAWFRDPPACKTTSLSNALELTYQP